MAISLTNPTSYSAVISVGLHFIIFIVAGNYVLSRDRLIPPPKSLVKLEILKRNKPAPEKVARPLETKQIARVIPPAFEPRKVNVSHETIRSNVVDTRSVPVVSREQLQKRVPSMVQSAISDGPVSSVATRAIRVRQSSVSQMQAQQDVSTPSVSLSGRMIQSGARRISVSSPKVTARNVSTSRGREGTALRLGIVLGAAKQFSSSFEARPVPTVSDQGALNGYTRGVQSKIGARKKYPSRAKKEGKEGQLTIQFTVLKSGNIRGLMLVSKSPYPELNRAALDAVRRAAPFPGLPDEIGRDYLDLVLPFNFKIKK